MTKDDVALVLSALFDRKPLEVDGQVFALAPGFLPSGHEERFPTYVPSQLGERRACRLVLPRSRDVEFVSFETEGAGIVLGSNGYGASLADGLNLSIEVPATLGGNVWLRLLSQSAGTVRYGGAFLVLA